VGRAQSCEAEDSGLRGQGAGTNLSTFNGSGLWVHHQGFQNHASGFRAQGLGFRAQGLGFIGFIAQGLGFRV
jgi:hypothetical protein